MSKVRTLITILSSAEEHNGKTFEKLYNGELESVEYHFERNHWDDDIAFLKTVGATNPEVYDYDEGFASYIDTDGRIYVLTV
jgi:hypothetical protein